MRYANSRTGTRTADNALFLRKIWEFPSVDGKEWIFMQSTSLSTFEFSGREHTLLWQEGKGLLEEYRKLGLSSIQGQDAWGQRGIIVSLMRKLPVTLYTGEIFDMNSGVVWPKKQGHLSILWAFCSSNKFNDEVRKIDQQLKLTTATLVKVPFDLNHWSKIAEERFPNGLTKPYSDDPTQWVFHGHPAQSEQPMQAAVARLLGFRWSAEQDSDMELSAEARGWVKKSEALLSFADEDGIVCIPPVRGEASGADRLLNLLAAAYGNRWSINKLAQLLRQVDHAGKTLETWLRDKFFSQHCKLFHHRPFIWHIWDGLRDGFAALVNYHKLDAKLLESQIYVYLGDWISRQKQDKANAVDGAEEKLAAAERLKESLELILEGEAPYDIFVRWKPIEKQPIGWAPDLNDGVRLNIRPFLAVPDVGRKGAGVLRDKPNINWNKDRGKDVKSAPWYHLGLQYGGREGDRINDHHLSLAEKRAAREAKKMETR